MDSSLTTVGAACLFGISLALRKEFEKAQVRVNELRIAMQVLVTEPEKKFQVSNKAIGSIVVGIAKNGPRGEVIRVGTEEEVKSWMEKLHASL